MIIQTSEVHMQATHEKSETRSFATTTGMQISSAMNGESIGNASDMSASARFQAMLDQFYGPANSVSDADANSEEDSSSILVMTKEGFRFRTAEEQIVPEEDNVLATIEMFRRLLAAISEQFAEQYNPDNSDVEEAQNAQQAAPVDSASYVGMETGQGGFPGLSVQMSFSSTQTIEEHESSQFSSAGTVTTADGKSISFDLDISMQRDYSYTQTNEFTQSVLFKDPIVINYPGTAAQLSDEKYAFDIDADGNDDLISYFNSGAMLALDKNNDGVINDGSELFGAISGNGFADLAAYDEDGNNYIDEADSIFADLKLWTKTDTQDSLASLSSMDVGAIYLGATDTPFDLKGEDNQANGKVRASSFYLTDAGTAGSVQQVDMVV